MTTRLAITGVVHGGHGIARTDEGACLAPGALPGDVIEASVLERVRKVLWAQDYTVVEPSPHRAALECPNVNACGACPWLHFAYPGQAEWKRRIVQETLSRLGGLTVEVDWREDPAWRLGYRTRATLHSDGEAWGFHARRSHRVAAMTQCLLCHEKLNAVIARLPRGVPGGSVEITVDPEGEAALAWTRTPAEPLRKAFPELAYPKQQGPRPRFLFDGVPVVAGGFSQASLLLNRLLRGAVHEFAGCPETVLDLYCGNGNLSLGFGSETEVLGVDHNRAAIEAADSQRPGAYRQGGEDLFRRTIKDRRWDVIILDPPRQGAKEITGALAKARADSLIYVSCDPAAMARDLRRLTAAGWTIHQLCALDLFPHVPHIETVALLKP